MDCVSGDTGSSPWISYSACQLTAQAPAPAMARRCPAKPADAAHRCPAIADLIGAAPTHEPRASGLGRPDVRRVICGRTASISAHSAHRMGVDAPEESAVFDEYPAGGRHLTARRRPTARRPSDSAAASVHGSARTAPGTDRSEAGVGGKGNGSASFRQRQRPGRARKVVRSGWQLATTRARSSPSATARGGNCRADAPQQRTPLAGMRSEPATVALYITALTAKGRKPLC